jgi:hypothetical protein
MTWNILSQLHAKKKKKGLVFEPSPTSKRARPSMLPRIIRMAPSAVCTDCRHRSARPSLRATVEAHVAFPLESHASMRSARSSASKRKHSEIDLQSSTIRDSRIRLATTNVRTPFPTGIGGSDWLAVARHPSAAGPAQPRGQAQRGAPLPLQVTQTHAIHWELSPPLTQTRNAMVTKGREE